MLTCNGACVRESCLHERPERDAQVEPCRDDLHGFFNVLLDGSPHEIHADQTVPHGAPAIAAASVKGAPAVRNWPESLIYLHGSWQRTAAAVHCC